MSEHSKRELYRYQNQRAIIAMMGLLMGLVGGIGWILGDRGYASLGIVGLIVCAIGIVAYGIIFHWRGESDTANHRGYVKDIYDVLPSEKAEAIEERFGSTDLLEIFSRMMEGADIEELKEADSEGEVLETIIDNLEGGSDE